MSSVLSAVKLRPCRSRRKRKRRDPSGFRRLDTSYFGDSWQHEIKVEKLIPYDPAMRLPVCLAGERACPPEDCGGVPGYYDALDALKQASTPEQKSLREWLGNYDPEHFDLEAINRRLQPKNTATRNEPSRKTE